MLRGGFFDAMTRAVSGHLELAAQAIADASSAPAHGSASDQPSRPPGPS